MAIQWNRRKTTAKSLNRSTEPSVSVVIACYNYARYLPTAIDSVLKQTQAVYEVVVVDDGSTDNTRDIIESYGSLIIPVFQENLGHNPAKVAGFNATKGDVILFLDADDYLLSGAIEEATRYFDPGVSKVQFDLEICDSEGRLLGRRYCDFPARYDADRVRRDFVKTGTYSWPVSSGNIYSRKLVTQVLPVDSLIFIDGVLNTIAPLYGRVETVAKSLGVYRHHYNSTSRQLSISKRIHVRKLEFECLRIHAQKLGEKLPDKDFLDSELVFVNYRMMARKLGDEDGDDSERTLFDLWRTGIKAAFSGPIVWNARIKHAIWMTCIAVAPAPLARTMIKLRFSRTELKAALRNLFTSRTIP
jgi:glycosyltransferase involved in cell wall biosynthesis